MIKKFEHEYVSYEELYHAYLDCRKRKRTTFNALDFEINENVNLYKLWYELNTMTYKIGSSIVFCVDKPVKREVFAADFRDRIVHHLVINRINDILEEEFIEDSYSCRKGKGTDYGIRKCYEYMSKASENYTNDIIIVKCDLKSFFMTIAKERLYAKLCNFLRIKYRATESDLNFMFWILKLIIFNRPQDNCIMKQSWEHWSDLPKEKSLFFCQDGLGLPIGNLTSQIFANFYLSEFDHFMKDILKIEFYGRYVDDFFFITDTIENATEILKLCKNKLLTMGVTLHPKKRYIQPIHNGVNFIGAMIKKDRIYVSNRTKGNLYWKLKEYDNAIERMDLMGLEPSFKEIEHMVGSINSYLGFMVHYKSFNVRKKILTSPLMQRINRYCYYKSDLKKLIIFDDYLSYHGKKKHITKKDYLKSKQDVKTGVELF